MRRLVRGLLQISILFCTAFFSSALPCSIEEDALVIYYDRHRCALVVTENSTFFEGVARRNPPCPQFCLVVATNYSGIVLLSEEGSIRFPFELNLSQVLDQNGRTNSSGNVVNCSLLLQKLGFEVISNLQSDPCIEQPNLVIGNASEQLFHETFRWRKRRARYCQSKHGEVLRKRRNRLIVVAPFSIVLTVVMIAIVVCHQCRLKPQYISFQKNMPGQGSPGDACGIKVERLREHESRWLELELDDSKRRADTG
ncbi:hypothetical protein QR680_006547 [Steinernema hermaphroditum]|uniref:Uncharacterized protein n=1 Tax=Steinernema hermaphroditum TaxID=289476 RepID=A0AA39HY13_9BILA|nr:hypothetical protein QR680_006547 [Steinernema hermaphroditum]